MRACRYTGSEFCKAYGIRYSVFVERWATIAENAEVEAQKYLMEHPEGE